MTTTPRQRGARLHIELDEELTAALDADRKHVRLKRKDFIRWVLSRQLLGTHALGTLAIQNGR
ncbi:hypothetical protein [Methylobacterium sp. J-076]|uniref:hypothetical protein n=1 Tax=Methylobacterium sp. J-076 TaxID=2836655 RepID=UPI001FBB0A3C|nr:hypothetical protein [Methylobacterium sp. J-076]MCJ2012175.1 hypothetical protein [Methylobacterium sp. J-076]